MIKKWQPSRNPMRVALQDRGRRHPRVFGKCRVLMAAVWGRFPSQPLTTVFLYPAKPFESISEAKVYVAKWLISKEFRRFRRFRKASGVIPENRK